MFPVFIRGVQTVGFVELAARGIGGFGRSVGRSVAVELRKVVNEPGARLRKKIYAFPSPRRSEVAWCVLVSRTVTTVGVYNLQAESMTWAEVHGLIRFEIAVSGRKQIGFCQENKSTACGTRSGNVFA